MIVTDQEELRKKSEDFKGTASELNQLFSLLEYELKDSNIPGVGLSGIQIGIPIRVAIIRSLNFSLNLYNAKIIKGFGSQIKEEGCLSLPNQWMNVERKTEIEIKNGDGEIITLKNFNARVAQHEMDHWEGILITDRRL
jgi:peptide deformylase